MYFCSISHWFFPTRHWFHEIPLCRQHRNLPLGLGHKVTTRFCNSGVSRCTECLICSDFRLFVSIFEMLLVIGFVRSHCASNTKSFSKDRVSKLRFVFVAPRSLPRTARRSISKITTIFPIYVYLQESFKYYSSLVLSRLTTYAANNYSPRAGCQSYGEFLLLRSLLLALCCPQYA